MKYYRQLHEKNSKTQLSIDEYTAVQKAVELILVSPNSLPYFRKTKIEHEIMHQVAVFFQYRGQDFKALLDGIRIDHAKRTIEPYDLKTIGSSIWEFPNNYIFFGYFRQAALYEYALQTEESPVKQLLDEGYKLLDFLFIVVESKTSSINPAMVFETSAYERGCGFKGGIVGGKQLRGIDNLLDDYI